MSILTVLVVDDDAFQRSVLRRLISSHGCDVIEATDGRHGLDALDNDDVDLVIVDLHMPHMDGVEFLRHLAERPTPPPVVVLSGEDRRVVKAVHQLADAHALTVLDAIVKPPTPNDIASALRRAASHVHVDPEVEPDLTPDAIRQGIADGRIIVHYQPKIRLSDGAVVGVEALARYADPTRGLLGPNHFVTVAEEGGFSLDLTRAVLAQAAEDASSWRDGDAPITVAVNVSVADLFDPNLVDEIMELIRNHDMPAQQLVLELTESRILGPSTTPVEILTRLRLRGIALAIDDFGTGASTLSQLQRLPFTSLKIDRAFVHGASHDADARSMLETTVTLAKLMELETVAEGAERLDDLKLVMDLGIDVVQGFVIARPMTADQLATWLAGFSSRPWPPQRSAEDARD